MPSTSAKQHRYMEMIAHNAKAAKRTGVPQSVGEEFAHADEGHHFDEGGMVCPSCGYDMDSEPDGDEADEMTEPESFADALVRKRGGGSGMTWYAANGGVVPRRVY